MHPISTLLQTVATEMKEYSNIRSDWNLGLAINGFLIKEWLDNLSKSIDRLTEVISKKETTVTVNPEIKFSASVE